MSKSWSEVKSVLDDPYVSADTKEALLAAYARETGFRNIPKEAYDYVDGTKASYDIDSGDAFAGRVIGTDRIYQAAKDESDAAGYGHRMNDSNVEAGRTEIEGMRLPAEGSSSGVQKSNEIFDAARPALRLFEDFLPINDKVPGDSLGRHGKIKLEDVRKRFDEQMGISFKNFLDDAKRLRDAYTQLNTLNGDTETELNKVYKEWTGPAANASYQYYSTKLAPNVTDLLEYLQTAPDTINTAVENVFTACKDKANDIIQLYQGFNGTMGSATPEMAGQVVKLANGDFDSQEEVLKVAAWVDASTGSNLESTMRADDCGLNDENKEYTIRECKKWIRQSFNTDLHDNLYANFKQACDDAFEAVNSHYETLNNYLKEYENKFGAPLAAPQPDSGGGGGDGGGNGGGGSGGGGGGTGSGGGGSGSGGGGGGMPSVPTPPTTDPGDQTNPSGDKPDGPTQPDSNSPPPSTTPTGEQQETVTIKDGEREISVTSPDGQGMVKVTVDDGSGQPKSYTLDFGGPDAAGTPGTPGQPGQPGQPGTPGAQPGTSGVPAPIEPGPDGKAVITDGDLTITAERPEGQPDTVVVTVDDGTGNPTTYNLDYSEAQTSGQPGEVPPQGPGGDRVTTMPAYGEMPPGMAQPGTDMPQGIGQPMPAYGEMPQGIAQPAGMEGVAPMPAEAPQGIAQPAGLQGAPMPADAPQGGPGSHGAGPMPGAGPLPGGPYGAGPAVMPQGVGHAMPADMPHGPGVGPQGIGHPMPAHMQGVGIQPAHGEMPAAQQGQHHAFATSASAADPSGGSHAPGGAAGSFGVPDQQPSPYVDRPSGEASLAGAPDSPPDQSDHQTQSQPGMAGGGMPMMGGAPAGGGSADAERAATQWRTTGDLFDEPADPQRLRGSFGGN